MERLSVIPLAELSVSQRNLNEAMSELNEREQPQRHPDMGDAACDRSRS